MIGPISQTVNLLRHFRAGFVRAHKNASGFPEEIPIIRIIGRSAQIISLLSFSYMLYMYKPICPDLSRWRSSNIFVFPMA